MLRPQAQAGARDIPFTEDDVKRRADGTMVSFFSHGTYLCDVRQKQIGRLFMRDADLWRHVEPGDAIGVLACAKYEKWELIGSEVKMYVWSRARDLH